MNIEQIETLFFAGMNPVTYRLFRASMPERYYYDPDDPSCFLYPSVTTIIRNGSPGSAGLERWKIQKAMEEGYANAGDVYAKERADFGTFMHSLNARFLMGDQITLDKIYEEYRNFLIFQLDVLEDDARRKADKHTEELQKAFLGFAKFCFDFQLKPIGVEVLLKSDHGFASAVDIMCELNFPIRGFWGETLASGANKGAPKMSTESKKIRAIIDMKSGKNLNEGYDLQLQSYRMLVEENFPEFFTGPIIDKEGIERVQRRPAFIWSPSEWKTEPGYKLTERNEVEELWRMVLKQGVHRLRKSSEDKVLVMSGSLKIGSDPSGLVQEVSIKDRLK